MKPSKPRTGKGTKKIILWTGAILVLALLAITHDIIITNILAYRICKADPNPKTFIKKTVDYPESIYWEDNIYPGFDENDRLLMIRNYLDGEHLKTMALNAPDGTIYLFSATPKDWRTSSEMDKKTSQDWKDYYKTIETEAKAIATRGKILTKQELPKFNYNVVFNPVSLNSFQSRYLYSDEVSITEKNTNQVIAYNRRLMHEFYILVPDFVGGRYYYPEAMCGESGYFLAGIVFDYSKKFHNQIKMHKISVETMLYDKTIKGGSK